MCVERLQQHPDIGCPVQTAWQYSLLRFPDRQARWQHPLTQRIGDGLRQRFRVAQRKPDMLVIFGFFLVLMLRQMLADFLTRQIGREERGPGIFRVDNRIKLSLLIFRLKCAAAAGSIIWSLNTIYAGASEFLSTASKRYMAALVPVDQF